MTDKMPDGYIHCEKLFAYIPAGECAWRSQQAGIEYYICRICKGTEKPKPKKYKGVKILTEKTKMRGICSKCGSPKKTFERGLCRTCYIENMKGKKRIKNES